MNQSVDIRKSKSLQCSLKNGETPLLKCISIQDVPCYLKRIESKTFSTPNLPEPYIAISFSSKSPQNLIHEDPILITADSEVVKARITSAKRLTKSDSAVKKTLELTLKFEDTNIEYKPGDVFGFICSNPPEEVSYLLNRLGKLDIADAACSITAIRGCKKKIPVHIPSVSSLRHILSSRVELRSVPKKVFLRVLAEYATDDSDRVSLTYLSSREGASLFEECIQKPSIGILDVLEVFKSCHPPIERALEYLPLLRPRFYSVASSPLVSEDMFRVVFNVINAEKSKCQIQERIGVCTGWLDSITSSLQKRSEAESVEDIASGISHLCIKDDHLIDPMLDVSIYKRFNKQFFLPEDKSVPIIMVGPGTGVAPFVGFLQHRERQMCSSSEDTFGETWLFYGCRHKKKDFIYRHELERLQSSKVLTHFLVCFSRDEVNADVHISRYVQDNIIQHAERLVEAVDSGGIIYVCGDAKGMAKDVQNAFIEAFKTVKHFSKDKAQSYLYELGSKKQYLVDLWK